MSETNGWLTDEVIGVMRDVKFDKHMVDLSSTIALACAGYVWMLGDSRLAKIELELMILTLTGMICERLRQIPDLETRDKIRESLARSFAETTLSKLNSADPSAENVIPFPGGKLH